MFSPSLDTRFSNSCLSSNFHILPSGSAGGQIVASGTPEQIAASPASHTGHYLSPHPRNRSHPTEVVRNPSPDAVTLSYPEPVEGEPKDPDAPRITSAYRTLFGASVLLRHRPRTAIQIELC